MGDLQDVVQVAPWFLRNGAAIAVRADGEAMVEAYYARERRVGYTHLYRASMSVEVDSLEEVAELERPGGLHVCVQGSGKGSYGQLLADVLGVIAAHLADATFYVDGVEEFRIAGGELHHSVVATGSALEYLRRRRALDASVRARVFLETAKDAASSPTLGLDVRSAIDEAVRCTPDDADLLAEAAYVLNEAGAFREALDLLARAEKLRPYSTDHELDRIRRTGGRVAYITERIRAAVWLGRVAYAHSKLGDRVAALAAYDRAIVLHPGSTGAHLGRGIVLMQQGQLDEAAAASEKARRYARTIGDVADATYNLACAKARRGDLDAALADLRVAVTLVPSLRGQLRDDDDLVALRGHAGFAALVA